jgi:hypothetical protein
VAVPAGVSRGLWLMLSISSGTGVEGSRKRGSPDCLDKVSRNQGPLHPFRGSGHPGCGDTGAGCRFTTGFEPGEDLFRRCSPLRNAPEGKVRLLPTVNIRVVAFFLDILVGKEGPPAVQATRWIAAQSATANWTSAAPKLINQTTWMHWWPTN